MSVPPSSQIQRLPFLQSSNLALDTLRGSDEAIGFEDILNGQALIPPPSRSHWHHCPNMISNLSFCMSTSCHLADPAQSEMMGEPHMMVEYKMGLLWKKMDCNDALGFRIIICQTSFGKERGLMMVKGVA